MPAKKKKFWHYTCEWTGDGLPGPRASFAAVMSTLHAAAQRDGLTATASEQPDEHTLIKVINRTGPAVARADAFCFEYIEIKDAASTLEAIRNTTTGLYDIAKLNVAGEGGTRRNVVKMWVVASIVGNHMAVTQNSAFGMTHFSEMLRALCAHYPALIPAGLVPRIGLGLGQADLRRLAGVQNITVRTVAADCLPHDTRAYAGYTRESRALDMVLSPEELSRRGLRVDMTVAASGRSEASRTSCESFAKLLLTQEHEHHLDYTIATKSGDISKGNVERLHEMRDVTVDDDGIPDTMMTFNSQLIWIDSLRDRGKITA